MILDEGAVRELLHMEDLIPAMARALADLSSGKVVQPMRTMIPIADHGGFLGLMPAYGGALGAKLVTFYPGNQGVPTHHAMIVLFRPETGEPLVTMDGRFITEMRTAAVSAVASQLLARPEASVLGILGSGVQARSHLEALRLVRAFRDIRVWSPRNARAFAKQFGIHAAPSAAGRCAAPTWSWWRRRHRRPCCQARGCRRALTSMRWEPHDRPGGSLTTMCFGKLGSMSSREKPRHASPGTSLLRARSSPRSAKW